MYHSELTNAQAGKSSGKYKRKAPSLCPFPDCGKLYTRAYECRKHVAAIIGTGGDAFHDIESPLLQELRDRGFFRTATRFITEQERSERKKLSHSRWRRDNANKLQESRKKRSTDIRIAPKIAKRAAQIAIKHREKLANSYLLHRSHIFQRLYRNTALSGGDDPLSLLDVDNTPTDATFPLMICLFLPNCEWPKVVQGADLDPQLPPPLLINQLPGVKEYRRLQMLPHPDRGPQQVTSTGRGGARLGLQPRSNSREAAPQDPGGEENKDKDYRVKPDNKLSSLLNTAWELWKPTVGAQEMQTATFLVGTESEEQFSQKSPVHKQILQLFGVWMETTDNVMHSIIPSGVSVLELHHFVNNGPKVLSVIQMTITPPTKRPRRRTKIT